MTDFVRKLKNIIVDEIHTVVVSLFFVPFIQRFLRSLVGRSTEQLILDIPSINKKYTFGGQGKTTQNNNDACPVVVYIDNPVHFCFLLMLDQKIGLGEAYMAGDWRAEPGPTEFLSLLIRAKRESNANHRASGSTKSVDKTPLAVALAALSSSLLSAFRYIVATVNYLNHRLRDNTVWRSRQNISEHYDLGNDMFMQFLDKSMTYSCALFEDYSCSVGPKVDFAYLEDAQYRKIDALLDTLQLSENDHVLEVGCGWGAAAIRAVQRHGCKWTGLTISSEQLELAQERVAAVGLEDKIDLKLLDYRLETGTYTAVLSIEMVEAVGEKFLPTYFQTIYDRLVPGGKAAIQAIVCPDAYYARYCRSSDFIKKHIFPGGHMPSVGAIQAALPEGMEMTMHREMGRHYAHTLDNWLCAWLENRREILSLGYSDTFHRKWQFYFALCSALFAYDHINAVQFTLTRPKEQCSSEEVEA